MKEKQQLIETLQEHEMKLEELQVINHNNNNNNINNNNNNPFTHTHTHTHTRIVITRQSEW